MKKSIVILLLLQQTLVYAQIKLDQEFSGLFYHTPIVNSVNGNVKKSTVYNYTENGTKAQFETGHYNVKGFLIKEERYYENKLSSVSEFFYDDFNNLIKREYFDFENNKKILQNEFIYSYNANGDLSYFQIISSNELKNCFYYSYDSLMNVENVLELQFHYYPNEIDTDTVAHTFTYGKIEQNKYLIKKKSSNRISEWIGEYNEKGKFNYIKLDEVTKLLNYNTNFSELISNVEIRYDRQTGGIEHYSQDIFVKNSDLKKTRYYFSDFSLIFKVFIHYNQLGLITKTYQEDEENNRKMLLQSFEYEYYD